VSDSGADFGFVGASYVASDPYQDRQECINFYVEISQDDKSKTPTALLGCPGLNNVFQLNTPPNGEVRGAWVLPGGVKCAWVAGNKFYVSTMTVPATQTSIAQFSVTQYGTLLTNTGQVSIRDNGNGGYVCIVDGPYGYLWNIATTVFTQIVDPAFYGADKVAFIDGWLIFNKPGTQIFYTTASVPYTVTFAGAFFALKDSNSDNLITLMENNKELWLVGERSSEVWYNAGGANFSFSRIPGVSPQVGCAAKNSIARLGGSLVWLGRSERGENVVIKTDQYTYTTISNRAVESQFAQYPLVSDAFGYTYVEDGHLFYVLTFPTADVTWCYDATTEQWHKRLSYDQTTGTFHRHRSNCFVNYQNIRMVGDYQSGYAMQMSRSFYTDAGAPLIALRKTPHVWKKEDRTRVSHSSLQIEFSPGVGLQTGQGVDPQVMIRWSDDGGATFGNQHMVTIGKAGRTKNRAIIRRLGQARDRVYEVSISDPVKRDVVGATLFASVEDEAA
jgi:hypothetical protein